MKKSRKGFTLVELLIVVAILAALAATMTVSMSGATAKAKAASIIANVESCCKAVQEYYYAEVNGATTAGVKTAEVFIKEAIPRWESFAAESGIYYTITGDAGKEKEWVLTVNFVADTDKANIAAAITAVKGFDKFYTYTAATTGENPTPESWALNESFSLATTANFKVRLWNGKIEVGS